RGVAEPLSGSEFEERLFVKQRLPAKERGSSQNGQSEEAGGPIGWKDSTKAPFEEGGRGHLVSLRRLASRHDAIAADDKKKRHGIIEMFDDAEGSQRHRIRQARR